MGVTRKERLLKAMLEDNSAACGCGVTREEKMLAGVARKTCENDVLDGDGGNSSVQPDWEQNDPTAADYVKNRPYYRTTDKIHVNDVIGDNVFPVTANTVQYNGMNTIQDERFTSVITALRGDTCEVLFDGKLYTCECNYSEMTGYYFGAPVSSDGAFDFSEYPFIFSNGGAVTATAGEHTFDIYELKTNTIVNYGSMLKVKAKHNDGEPYLDMETVEEIKNAWKKDIPVIIDSRVGSLGVSLTVTNVTTDFIYASAVDTEVYGVTVYAQMFSCNDGGCRRNTRATVGTITENHITRTTMFINNKWYKIDVDSSGNLKATEITS